MDEKKNRNPITAVKNWLKARKKDEAHYMSSKELRDIAKSNRKTVRTLEARLKRQNVSEAEYVTQMKDDNNVVEFDDLHTFFFTDTGIVKAVDGVSFSVPQGSTVGIVGESGCGKSVTSLSLMQLVQRPSGQIVSGAIRFKTKDYVRGRQPLIAGEGFNEQGMPTVTLGEPVRDPKGKPIPIYETNGDGTVKYREVTDKNGAPVLERDGKIKLEPVQALDDEGFPAFVKEDKTFDIAKMPLSEMQRLRGKEMAMIFQEPMTSLNPVFTVGNQMDEIVLLHTPGANKVSAKARSIEMLNLVGIAMPESVYKRYPHELSGGMRQRVMIAMALACNPRLIIADEPTTALDVTIQAQILDLLREVKTRINGSIMLITHDLGVIAEMADYVVVMYAGRIIEMGTAKDIFDHPLHPYTIGLQKSKPVVNKKVDRLYSISGQVPNPINMPPYCYFRDRCDRACAKCAGEYPGLKKVSDTHSVSCYLYDEEP